MSSYASERGRHNALERLAVAPTDAPIVAQIWGKDPEHFAMTAGALEGLGFAGVDINMGCPDKNVNKTGGGAAMTHTCQRCSISSNKTCVHQDPETPRD